MTFITANWFDITSNDTVVIGGRRGRGVAVLGVTRTLGSTALNARLEGTYQLATSSPREPSRWSGLLAVRQALRDEAFGINAGFEWNAVPKSAWSPYLITTVGTLTSRMSFSTDSLSESPDRSVVSTGLAANLGIGFRARLFGANVFVETRRQLTYNVNGSRVLPLVAGLRLR